MMGPRQRIEPKLFYTGLNPSDRVSCDNPLRAIAAKIDFDFVRAEVAEFYGTLGNPSIDPTVLMKLMFILFYDNVRSERALAQSAGRAAGLDVVLRFRHGQRTADFQRTVQGPSEMGL